MKSMLYFMLLIFSLLLSSVYGDDSEFGDIEMLEDSQTEVQEESLDHFYYFNKTMYGIYKGAYHYAGGRYLAIFFSDYVPSYLKERMRDFRNNSKDPTRAVNHFLQLRFNAGFESSFRFFANSTLGFLGFWDVMSPLGISVKDNDFGATFYFIGVPSGPYLIFFGPGNIRDSLGVISVSFLEEYYIPMYDFYMDNYSIKLSSEGGVTIEYSTMFSILSYVEIYHKSQSVANNAFNEYQFIKNISEQSRKVELNKISQYN